MNPSRAGDTELIYWMFKDRGDFYYEDFRTVKCQVEIIKKALRDCPGLLELTRHPKKGKYSWHRNIKAYLGMCACACACVCACVASCINISLSLSLARTLFFSINNLNWLIETICFRIKCSRNRIHQRLFHSTMC